MNFDDVVTKYYEFVPTTAVYPTAGERTPEELMYLSLGLVAEVHEFLATVQGEVDHIKESGDIFWYGSNIAKWAGEKDLLGIIMSGVASANAMKDKIVVEKAMPRLAAQVADIAKKNFRDGEINKDVLLGNVTALLGVVANTIGGYDALTNMFEMNMEKLSSRKERNVIVGSGDNR